MRIDPPRSPRRRRPHPARRARKIVGTASVAGMVLLTGCMTVAGKSTSAPTVSATVVANTSSTTAATTAPTAAPIATSDDSAWPDQPTGASAGTVSAQADTSTHGS
jgi:hypothetical protein